jgi:hypothetical protein
MSLLLWARLVLLAAMTALVACYVWSEVTSSD